MIQAEFQRFERPEPIRLSGDQFALLVQPATAPLENSFFAPNQLSNSSLWALSDLATSFIDSIRERILRRHHWSSSPPPTAALVCPKRLKALLQ